MMQQGNQKIVGIDGTGLSDAAFQQLARTFWRADADGLVLAASAPGEREAALFAEAAARGLTATQVTNRGEASQGVTWLTPT